MKLAKYDDGPNSEKASVDNFLSMGYTTFFSQSSIKTTMEKTVGELIFTTQSRTVLTSLAVENKITFPA